MPPEIFYSPEKDDLDYPCKRGNFFPAGVPKSEAALCAEMARLSYCRQESGFAFDQGKIRSVLASIEFTDCQFFESQGGEKGRGTHCFLALREDMGGNSQIAVLAFRGTDIGDFTNFKADVVLIPGDPAFGLHLRLRQDPRLDFLLENPSLYFFARSFAVTSRKAGPSNQKLDCPEQP